MFQDRCSINSDRNVSGFSRAVVDYQECWRRCASVQDSPKVSPHFSPGGAIMAQEFYPQRVLASEGRSGDYVRASMCALRGKGQARARPAPSVPRRLQTKRPKMLKTSTFRHFAQRPGEKCGLADCEAVERLRDSDSSKCSSLSCHSLCCFADRWLWKADQREMRIAIALRLTVTGSITQSSYPYWRQ